MEKISLTALSLRRNGIPPYPHLGGWPTSRVGPATVKFVTQECETRPYLATFLMAGGIVMRRTILASALISFLCVHVSSAWAWWDAGHMQIAYVAYKHLDAPVKDKVDALLK